MQSFLKTIRYGFRKGKILVIWMDIMTSQPVHVELNESMTEALIREVKEELAVDISKDKVKFGTFMHKFEEGIVYYNAFFVWLGS